MDAEVVLYENGRILTQYRNLDSSREEGDSATIGIENESGTVALQYSFSEASVSNGLAVLYRLPPSGFVEGRVTDANDNLALAGATVKAIHGGSVFRETTTDSNGNYRMQLPLDTYTIEASASNYESQSAEVVLDQEDEVVTRNFALRTARAVVSPNALEFIVTPNSTKTKQLVLRNTGGLDMTWQIREAGGGQVATTSPRGSPRLRAQTRVPTRQGPCTRPRRRPAGHQPHRATSSARGLRAGSAWPGASVTRATCGSPTCQPMTGTLSSRSGFADGSQLDDTVDRRLAG